MFGWCLIATPQVQAQESQQWLFIETDPMSTIIGARTLWLGIEPSKLSHFSFAANITTADFSNDIDDLLNPHNKGKGLDARVKIGGGLAIDYFFQKQQEKWYLGIINLLFVNEVSLNNQQMTALTHNVFGRVGYRWYPFQQKGFYVNPFLGFRYEYLPNGRVMLENQLFEAAGLQPFGSVHIGYHF
ncbi:hypothetical protein BKI52_39325 [marine bacterium AO1-C]|nr:hypothetical protein BKI52_39325 [marine bacterium AO1-C]